MNSPRKIEELGEEGVQARVDAGDAPLDERTYEEMTNSLPASSTWTKCYSWWRNQDNSKVYEDFEDSSIVCSTVREYKTVTSSLNFAPGDKETF
jgi:hypothetical protein